jgi:hypothetical protein
MNVLNYLNIKLSVTRSKAIDFASRYYARTKIIINDKRIEDMKLNKFQMFCGTLRRTLRDKTKRNPQATFYEFVVVPGLTYGCENWAIKRSDKCKIKALK